MDDQDDRGYSRAPELEDLLRLCKALNAENVQYVKSACGVDFARAADGGIETKVVDGVPIPVARKELLIETKQTVRPSDATDIQFLRLRIASELEGN